MTYLKTRSVLNILLRITYALQVQLSDPTRDIGLTLKLSTLTLSRMINKEHTQIPQTKRIIHSNHKEQQKQATKKRFAYKVDKRSHINQDHG